MVWNSLPRQRGGVLALQKLHTKKCFLKIKPFYAPLASSVGPDFGPQASPVSQIRLAEKKSRAVATPRWETLGYARSSLQRGGFDPGQDLRISGRGGEGRWFPENGIEAALVVLGEAPASAFANRLHRDAKYIAAIDLQRPLPIEASGQELAAEWINDPVLLAGDRDAFAADREALDELGADDGAASVTPVVFQHGLERLPIRRNPGQSARDSANTQKKMPRQTNAAAASWESSRLKAANIALAAALFKEDTRWPLFRSPARNWIWFIQ